jgi:hypothetical protein
MEMTNQNDALVAEAVGYTFFRAGDIVSALFTVPPSEDAGYFFTLESVQAKDIDDEDKFAAYREPPPFLSAPTGNTDQIVLEWVQGQENEFRVRFEKALKEVLKVEAKVRPTWGDPDSWLGMFLDYQKPGMYAQALLAVIQEERGE